VGRADDNWTVDRAGRARDISPWMTSARSRRSNRDSACEKSWTLENGGASTSPMPRATV